MGIDSFCFRGWGKYSHAPTRSISLNQTNMVRRKMYMSNCEREYVDLKLGELYEGFTASHANCIDIPIAGAASVFEPENYYAYCAHYCAHVNWTKDLRWLDMRQHILSHLGIRMERLLVDDSTVLGVIYEALRLERPVVLIVKYGALFYSEHYRTGKYDHAIVVSGYDRARGTCYIHDREMIRSHIRSGLMKCDVLHRFQITESMLVQIWKDTQIMYATEESVHAGSVYGLSGSFAEKKSRDDCIRTILRYSDRQCSNFCAYIERLEVGGAVGAEAAALEQDRRQFHRSLVMLFHYIERTDSYATSSRETLSLYKERKVEMLRNRAGALNVIQISQIKGTGLTGAERRKLQLQVTASDAAMFDLLDEVFRW